MFRTEPCIVPEELEPLDHDDQFSHVIAVVVGGLCAVAAMSYFLNHHQVENLSRHSGYDHGGAAPIVLLAIIVALSRWCWNGAQRRPTASVLMLVVYVGLLLRAYFFNHPHQYTEQRAGGIIFAMTMFVLFAMLIYNINLQVHASRARTDAAQAKPRLPIAIACLPGVSRR